MKINQKADLTDFQISALNLQKIIEGIENPDQKKMREKISILPEYDEMSFMFGFYAGLAYVKDIRYVSEKKMKEAKSLSLNPPLINMKPEIAAFWLHLGDNHSLWEQVQSKDYDVANMAFDASFSRATLKVSRDLRRELWYTDYMRLVAKRSIGTFYLGTKSKMWDDASYKHGIRGGMRTKPGTAVEDYLMMTTCHEDADLQIRMVISHLPAVIKEIERLDPEQRAYRKVMGRNLDFDEMSYNIGFYAGLSCVKHIQYQHAMD